jgi:aminomethyltransferase
MVTFAGWSMPLQYALGIKAEHLATRKAAGLFDISHMGQIDIIGNGAAADLANITPTNIAGIGDGKVRYSMFLNSSGGVLDDLMISRVGDRFHLIVNASRTEHDVAYLNSHVSSLCQITNHENKALLALQGPQAAVVLNKLGLELNGFTFMHIRQFEFNNDQLLIARTGYTGEDGFEISLPANLAASFCDACLATGYVTLAGLGARDTLRMEAGLPLWGHELDETITPIAAGLEFSVSKKRLRDADFIGAKYILDDIENGPKQRLVGLLADGARPVRDGTYLFDGNKQIGEITSGGFAPSLERPAALGFVAAAYTKPGTRFMANTRGSPTAVTVTALPFVPHRYFRG